MLANVWKLPKNSVKMYLQKYNWSKLKGKESFGQKWILNMAIKSWSLTETSRGVQRSGAISRLKKTGSIPKLNMLNPLRVLYRSLKHQGSHPCWLMLVHQASKWMPQPPISYFLGQLKLLYIVEKALCLFTYTVQLAGLEVVDIALACWPILTNITKPSQWHGTKCKLNEHFE